MVLIKQILILTLQVRSLKVKVRIMKLVESFHLSKQETLRMQEARDTEATLKITMYTGAAMMKGTEATERMAMEAIE